jgi:hypothetical protein
VITTPVNGWALATSVVATCSVDGVMEIGIAPPVVIVDVVDAVSPASAMAAVTAVATGPAAPTRFAAGVNTNSSRAAATAADDPDIVHTPFTIELPSVVAFGSKSVPLDGELRVTVAVVVCAALPPVMITPLNGAALAVAAVVIADVAE